NLFVHALQDLHRRRVGQHRRRRHETSEPRLDLLRRLRPGFYLGGTEPVHRGGGGGPGQGLCRSPPRQGVGRARQRKRAPSPRTGPGGVACSAHRGRVVATRTHVCGRLGEPHVPDRGVNRAFHTPCTPEPHGRRGATGCLPTPPFRGARRTKGGRPPPPR